MSFQTFYSIKYGGSEHSRPLLDQNFEKLIAPASVYRELSESPFNARKYFGAPPLGIINVLSLRGYQYGSQASLVGRIIFPCQHNSIVLTIFS